VGTFAGGVTIAVDDFTNPKAEISSVHGPSGRLRTTKLPSSFVYTVNFLSAWVRVTVAPGIGRFFEATRPVKSAAGSIETAKRRRVIRMQNVVSGCPVL